MNGAAPGPIVALVTHARQVPAIERERFAMRLHGERTLQGFILQTCHRVEAYTSSPVAENAAAALPAGGRTLTGEAAVRHAITVAIGRDSVVVGEDQVLHQLRASVDAARRAGTLHPSITRLFGIALRAGRRARSWRQGPSRSLADVAISSIEGRSGPLRGRDILVVGAGRMGRLAARAAVAADASVAVANRSPVGAEVLAASTGARIEKFDPGERIRTFAGVVVALAGPWSIGTRTVEALARSTTTVVDLSVPPAVPAGLEQILGTRLITADALALSDAETAAKDEPARRLDALVDRSTEEFLDWLKAHSGRAAAAALVERADLEREAELAALWRRLPDLEPDARDAIEGMTRHLADRLLREPLERLGHDADGRDERAIRDIFGL